MIIVIPGQKLCSKCRLTYSKSKTDIDQIETNVQSLTI